MGNLNIPKCEPFCIVYKDIQLGVSGFLLRVVLVERVAERICPVNAYGGN